MRREKRLLCRRIRRGQPVSKWLLYWAGCDVGRTVRTLRRKGYVPHKNAEYMILLLSAKEGGE